MHAAAAILAGLIFSIAASTDSGDAISICARVNTWAGRPRTVQKRANALTNVPVAPLMNKD